MALLLQFFGISDPLHLFELEQRYPRGPVFAGFRPCQLDRLLSWGGLDNLSVPLGVALLGFKLGA